MKKNLLTIILLMSVIIVLVGCGNSKPDDVSQEFWDHSIQTVLYIDDGVKNDKDIEVESVDKLKELQSTDIEKDITKAILNQLLEGLRVGLANFYNKGDIEISDEYKEAYKEVETLLGSKNLNSKNYDRTVVLSYVNQIQEEENKEKQIQLDYFKRKSNVTLTGRDVQYDIYNNLNKPFFINGRVELCDYFNYGFTNDISYFCGFMIPEGGTSSERWHLYFNRKSFKSVYDALLQGDVDLMVIAEISNKNYKRNQGNMAAVKKTQGY